jgi:hypothetical protein
MISKTAMKFTMSKIDVKDVRDIKDTRDVKDVQNVYDVHKEQDVHVLITVPEFRDGFDV